MSPLSNDVVIEAIRAMVMVTYFDLAASTLFIWDFVLTLPLELDLIWREKYNGLTVLYMAQRYLPFLDTVLLVLYRQTTSGLSDSSCKKLYIASWCLIITGMGCSEVILTLRAWAVWTMGSPHRRRAIVLASLFALVWLPNIAYLGIFLFSLEFNNPADPNFTGCLVVHVNHILVLYWTVVLVWDAFIVALMVSPALKVYSLDESRSRIREAVFRDGALYYLVLLLLSAVNIVIVSRLPAEYSQLLTGMGRCFHSILTSRLVLHVRVYITKVPAVFRHDALQAEDFLDHPGPLNTIPLIPIIKNPNHDSRSTLSMSA